MNQPIVESEREATGLLRQPCLVAGCPCKDARFVSRRRAAFHAATARARGQTADRVIPIDPEWRVPDPSALGSA